MSDHQPSDPAKIRRQKRLEEQLRENLRRRKMQARARETEENEAPSPADGQNEDDVDPG